MKRWKIFGIVIVVGSVLLTSITFYVYQLFTAPNILVKQNDKIFVVPTHATFKSVQNALYDGGYVNDLVAFSFLAKLYDYDLQVKPGRYLLKGDMSSSDAVILLRSGRQTPLNITFNNIRLKKELAEKICRKVAADSQEFETLLKDSSVADRYGYTLETFMSMFIPNTYEVYWTITAPELMDRMYHENLDFWTETRKYQAEKLEMSQLEISILASIVMAETKHNQEIQRIAGVYLNRLKRGIALQADPTLIYAVGDFSIKRVLNKHKEFDSPYNTYMYRGLPPGPINLPSITAIDAVLNHEKHKYLYFCAKEDFSGYHNFATNLRDHNENARKWQNALNRARLYR